MREQSGETVHGRDEGAARCSMLCTRARARCWTPTPCCAAATCCTSLKPLAPTPPTGPPRSLASGACKRSKPVCRLDRGCGRPRAGCVRPADWCRAPGRAGQRSWASRLVGPPHCCRRRPSRLMAAAAAKPPSVFLASPPSPAGTSRRNRLAGAPSRACSAGRTAHVAEMPAAAMTDAEGVSDAEWRSLRYRRWATPLTLLACLAVTASGYCYVRGRRGGAGGSRPRGQAASLRGVLARLCQ